MGFPTSVVSLLRPQHTDRANDGNSKDLTILLDAHADEIEAIETALGANLVNVRTAALDVRRYGAVIDNATDDAGAFNAALTAAVSGQAVYAPPGSYKVAANVTIPAGVTLNLAGAINLGTNAVIRLDGAGAKLTGVGSINYATSSVPSYAVRHGRDNCVVDGLTFTGTARTAAIRVAYDDVGTDVTSIQGGGIRNCLFSGTAYGILKLDTACVTSDFSIRNVSMLNIVGGDGIEWNLGNDDGLIIDGVQLNGVARGSVANAGIGIGVAGLNSSQDETVQGHRFIITNVNAKNVGEGVHVEGCNRFMVSDVVVVNAQNTAELSGAGCVVYNSTKFTINNVNTYDSHQGVAVEPASSKNCADFIVSNCNSYLCGNHGFHIDLTGSGATKIGAYPTAILNQNHSFGCGVNGFLLTGSAIWYLRDNTDVGSVGNSLAYTQSGDVTTIVDNVSPYVGTTAPADTVRLWVDTS